MSQFLKDFLFALLGVLIIDGIWLGLIARNFYFEQLKPLARLKDGGFAPLLVPALGVYIAIALGLALFVLPKARELSSMWHAAAFGAAFGAVTYAVFELTNYSIVNGWPPIVVVVDILWGAAMCAIITAVVVRV